MKTQNLKPWSLRWLGKTFLYAFFVFMAVILALMLGTLGQLKAGVAVKVCTVLLAIGMVGCGVSLQKWTRYWPDVAWDISFFRFISEPPPPEDYKEARQAWVWGRRYMVSWLIVIIAVAFVAVFMSLESVL